MYFNELSIINCQMIDIYSNLQLFIYGKAKIIILNVWYVTYHIKYLWFFHHFFMEIFFLLLLMKMNSVLNAWKILSNNNTHDSMHSVLTFYLFVFFYNETVALASDQIVWTEKNNNKNKIENFNDIFHAWNTFFAPTKKKFIVIWFHQKKIKIYWNCSQWCN